MTTSSAPTAVSLQVMLDLLQGGTIDVRGLMPHGSNFTFLASVGDGTRRTLAVYKPVRGECGQWDFPPETLAFREVAAFLVSEVLGWGCVPPTVYRCDGPHGPGALQFYIQAQPGYNYFHLPEADRPELRRVAAFDILINNADRKSSHILKDQAGKLWVIDHGLCFHIQPKLRTVIWEFAGEPIPAHLLADVADFRRRLDSDPDLQTAAGSLLPPTEVDALRHRADRMLAHPNFPAPGAGRNYPWPPM